jgi:hypothetical protein
MKVPIIFLVVTSLAVVNFLATGFLLHFILNDAEHSDEGDYSLAGSIVAPATPPLEVENNSSVNGSVESRVYFIHTDRKRKNKADQGSSFTGYGYLSKWKQFLA